MTAPSAPSAPLGVFDSGLGGLTVVRALRACCPAEDIVYLGDTARVPYGPRSPETIVRYALGCSRVLTRRGVKAIVVACNTVSAVALDMLRIELDLPVLGVILPGARAAVAASSGAPVGVLGTAGTISSGAYPRAIAALSTRTEIIGQPAPLLVSLAEEGWLDGEVPRLVARRYLEPVVQAGARTIVLGCTHFPLLREPIEAEATALAGRPLTIVDSASATADEVAAFLVERGLATARSERGKLHLMVTDRPRSFSDVAARFLGEPAEDVEVIDL
ncbi:glutamate racemase [Chondromyces apiculatus]|uniref:Glutamate racemase n=1 Tax=Chondromyces apiculatus DSM 436 TaxID=1192034 RepID=A0A017T302_9BACT|nr:glutamate racemase [Chondromyces apiculatus]EYF03382.1 Glutamate racemase [Chondromyces apiculatus DSM 436]